MPPSCYITCKPASADGEAGLRQPSSPALQAERPEQLTGPRTAAGDIASGQPPQAGASRAPGLEAGAGTAELSSFRDLNRP